MKLPGLNKISARQNRNPVFIILVSFMLGVVFSGGAFLAYKKAKPLMLKVCQKLEELRINRIPQAVNPLVLSDFETPADIGKWESDHADLALSSEHCSAGGHSLQIIFHPDGGASSVKIEDFFRKDKRLSNWSRYEVLSFDLFNPQEQEERVILQIKDRKGNKIKRDIFLPARALNNIQIDIRDLWEEIKPDRVDQFNLFLWNNPRDKVFFLDNLRLLPAGGAFAEQASILSPEFLPQEGEPVYKRGDYFAFEQARWQKTDPRTGVRFVEVPLVINNCSSADLNGFVFSGGVPFAKGELASLENIQVVGEEGTPVPFQAKTLAKWPDGSIKWALVDARTSVAAGQKQPLFLRYGEQISRPDFKTRLQVSENNDEIVVNTGDIQFSVCKKGFNLFNNVCIDKNRAGQADAAEQVGSSVSLSGLTGQSSQPLDSRLRGNDRKSNDMDENYDDRMEAAKRDSGDLALERNGQSYYSSLDKGCAVSIEEKGPLKVCLKACGWFISPKGERFCRYIVRIYAYAGSDIIKFQHTFVYTGYPGNKYHYLYQGVKLPPNETIEAVYLKFPWKFSDNAALTFSADGQVQGQRLDGAEAFLQDEYDGYTLSSNGRLIHSGKQMDGWIDIRGKEAGVAVGVKNFWQQFPKGFRLDKDYVYVDLWPREAGALDLKTTQAADGPDAVARGSAFGLAKTHELTFYFHQPELDLPAEQVMPALGKEILLTAAPQWTADTRVLGKISAYDKRLGPAEEFLSRLFHWGEKQIVDFHWYGMIDFGDTLSWYRKEAYDKSYDDWGWHPEGRWGWFNCEAAGTHSGALIQFLRTGDLKYFIFGANLARHIMDIDTCHYNTVANDPRLSRKITADYSQPGSMHRHNGDHWGGRNEEASHTNVYGLLLYYYVTGDARAKDVIEEVGQFLLSGRVTYYKHPDIAPQRTLANVLWGDVQLYELTGGECYKDAADKWAQILVYGQKNDGAWAENYNPPRKRWDGKTHLGFMTGYTLPALIAYHQLTGNKAVAQSIVKATDFIIKNEAYAAYFDASSYSYWLTADEKYRNNIKDRMEFSIRHQNQSSEAITNGMIYQKAYYARVMEYLYSLPFALDVFYPAHPAKPVN